MSGRRRGHAAPISWWRLWSIQGSFSPAHRQWLGWVVALEGARKAGTKERDGAETDEEPAVLNTNPYFAGMLAGARLASEEQDGREVARVLTQALQSALGALGDQLWWKAIRPATTAWAAVAAIVFGPVGVLTAWLAFAVGQAGFRRWALAWGYARGASIAEALPRLGLHAAGDRIRIAGSLGAGALAGVLLATRLGTPEADRADVLALVAAVAVGALMAWRRTPSEWVLLLLAAGAWIAARVAG